MDNKDRKKVKIAIFVLIIISYIWGFLSAYTFCSITKVHAAVLLGDEPLGGFSYMIDCLEKNDIPEEYARLLRLWHPAYEISRDEYDILVRIVEAEATGGKLEQKMNVASCVIARMESPNWPNDIHGVVFQKTQFSPIDDGRYYSVKITDSSKKAVDEVLKFGKTHDCLWFCSDKSYRKENSYHRKNHTWVFFDGMHHYFYD